MKLASILAAAASVAVLASAAPALAQTQWTMATGYPDDSFFTENIRQFIAEVEEATGGELKIDLRTNDSLIKHDAIKRAVQSGQVQAGEIRLAVYGNEGKMYDLDNLPNLVADYDDAWKLMEAQKPFFEDLFEQNGMKIVTYAPWPGQGFYTSGAVTSLDDLQGKSMRIYSRQTQTMGEMLGMNAIILPFAEVPQAFSTGLIESLWTSAQTGTDVQAWDYVDHFTYTGSMHNKNAIIINAQAFEQLDEAAQQAVLEAGERATERGWELSRQASEEKEAELAENGMTVEQAPDDIMEKMQEIGVTMMEEWRSGASEQELAVLDAYLQSAEL